MSYQNRPKPPPRPLDAERLRALALHYAGRYATTKGKLGSYLNRKIRERGWEGERPANLEALIQEFAELGYVNDAGFAEARARSFVRRGFGTRRLSQDLNAAGISESDGLDAMQEAQAGAWASADNFAKRKRIGPYAQDIAEPALKQKQLQAFLRAGHSWDISRIFVNAEPGEELSELE